MSRYIATIIVLFLGFNTVLAQKLTPKYQLGFKAAFIEYKSRFNFSEDEELYDQKYRSGFQVGGVLDLPLANVFHFYTEIYYAMKGKKTYITSSGLTNNARYHYIEAPILLRFSFNGGSVPSGNLKWHIDVGPSISYWLGGKGYLQAGGPKSDYKVKFGNPPENNSDFGAMYITNPNRWQWGLNAGVGIDYPVTKGQIVFVDFRAGFGSTDLGKFDSRAELPVLGFSDSMQVRYLEFVLSVAYTFEIHWISTLKGKSTRNNRRQY
jgi:hypothetical protein